jgi:four helix bundle protein
MSGINNFHDLKAWRKGHKLTLEIYKITASFPKEEQFGLTSQLRRAAASITANLAEGFERYHSKDRIRFYYHSKGSIGEVQNFLLLAKDLKYIDINKCRELGVQANEIRKLISGLIRATGFKKS